MSRRYIQVWMPVQAMQGFKIKQQRIQDAIKEQTGKTRRVPMTRILSAVAERPLFLDDMELRRIASKRKFIGC